MESLSLSDFNQLIKSVLDKHLEKSYWIVAEIGEMNVNQKGHCYMELVEKKDNFIVAKNRATIWSYTFANLENWFAMVTGTPLRQGMKILVNAAVQYHEVYGFSLNIKDIDANFTIGERERKKQETIRKLEQEGIIDMNKALTLPIVPQHIAVISSETAAGFGDFMHQLENNDYGYRIQATLFASTMQGDQAVASIIDALHRIYEQEDRYEMVVLIRGGGAKTDLDCFDDYELCAHLAQFPLPVVTGIGHERDNTIADMVAHTRMKTPTAVAEFILGGFITYESNINELVERISRASAEKITHEQENINRLAHQLQLAAQKQCYQQDLRLNRLEENLKNRSLQAIKDAANNLTLLEKTISSNDPQRILDRGYTITTINGKPALKVKNIKPGDRIITQSKNEIFESTAN